MLCTKGEGEVFFAMHDLPSGGPYYNLLKDSNLFGGEMVDRPSVETGHTSRAIVSAV